MGNNVVIVSVVSFRKLLEIAIYKDTRYAVWVCYSQLPILLRYCEKMSELRCINKALRRCSRQHWLRR
jgi:hypothetical protein